MQTPEELFHEIAASLADAKEGKMFGALCIKAPNGKAGVMLHKGENMIFKLPKEEAEQVLRWEGTGVFTPMEGRPMNGWIQVPPRYADNWKELAVKAHELVKALKK